jgi:hypothetical protein
MSDNTQDPITTEIIRALDDLHSEFQKASKTNNEKYDGAAKTTERSTRLIEVYSIAVERLVDSYVRTFI